MDSEPSSRPRSPSDSPRHLSDAEKALRLGLVDKPYRTGTTSAGRPVYCADAKPMVARDALRTLRSTLVRRALRRPWTGARRPCGRAARPAANGRTRGSRRTPSRSAGGGDSPSDSDEPPGGRQQHLANVAPLMAPWATERFGNLNTAAQQLLRGLGELP